MKRCTVRHALSLQKITLRRAEGVVDAFEMTLCVGTASLRIERTYTATLIRSEGVYITPADAFVTWEIVRRVSGMIAILECAAPSIKGVRWQRRAH